MSSILRGIFDFRSKEEKERSYEAYSKRIFPYGDEQKNKVSELLAALFPAQKQQYLIMHYILIKQGMTEDEPMDFETAATKAAKYRLVPVTAELQAAMHALINIDMVIDEKLEYPSLEELRTAANNISSSSSL